MFRQRAHSASPSTNGVSFNTTPPRQRTRMTGSPQADASNKLPMPMGATWGNKTSDGEESKQPMTQQGDTGDQYFNDHDGSHTLPAVNPRRSSAPFTPSPTRGQRRRSPSRSPSPMRSNIRPSTAPNMRPQTGASSWGESNLPPSLSHLSFLHQSFPPFLVSLASRVFHAKCRDLNITPSLEKERRFVWLACKQSMGGIGGTGMSGSVSSSGGSVSSPPRSPPPGGSGSDAFYLSIRMPDAALGPLAIREICSALSLRGCSGNNNIGLDESASSELSARDVALLQLSGNALGDESADQLAELLRQNDNLTSLDIRGTGLGQHSMSKLFDAVTEHPTLTSLEASSLKAEGRMFVGGMGCGSLARLLRRNTTLKRLHLSNAGLVAEGLPGVFRGLSLNRTLRNLDLSLNDIGAHMKNIQHLATALAACSSLHVLNLMDNRLGTIGVALLAEHAFRKMEHLKRLDLRKNALGLKALTILTDAVGDMISLQELLLDGNAMGESTRDSVLSAGAGISNAASLVVASEALMKSADYVEGIMRKLHLSDKRVSPRLLQNTALRTLSLNQTQLSDRAVIDLCRVLRDSKGLQALYLNGNGLGDPSGMALAELIRISASLQSLHLSDNSMSDESGTAICVSLGHPSSRVCFLSMRVNNVAKLTGAAILHALGLKNTLHVDLNGNRIPWLLYSKVTESSARNKRRFEASRCGRYQEEWNRLQQRHEYRLHVEEQCVESVEEGHVLERQLQELQDSKAKWMEDEQNETKTLQLQLADLGQALQDAFAAEKGAENEVNAFIKENESKVAALRKCIEKEQRFILGAEKMIPQTREELSGINADIEVDCADAKRDLRLLTNERNVEYDACMILKADLEKFIQTLQSQTKGKGRKSRAVSRAPSRAPSRPASSRGPTARANSASKTTPTRSRPGSALQSANQNGTTTTTTSGSKKKKMGNELTVPQAADNGAAQV